MDERELRASLLAVGAMQPVLIYEGETKDGRKRERICLELGIPISVRHLHTRAELCTALWATHPERAISEAQTNNLLELAELCNAKPAAIAVVLKALRAPLAKTDRRIALAHSKARNSEPYVVAGKKVLLYMEPQLKEAVKRAGEHRHLNMSQAIRVASWEWVTRVLGSKAPTEGKRRGPRVEHVRPQKRRAR